MTKWEYKAVTIRPNDGEWKNIESHGAEGWELVTVVPYTTTMVTFYLKRPLVKAPDLTTGDDGYQWLSWFQGVQPNSVAADDLIEWQTRRFGTYISRGPLRADQVPWVSVSAYRVVRPTPDDVSCF